MKFIRFLIRVPFLFLLFVLCSCASMSSLTKETSGPRVYYVGIEGLKLFPGPRFSEECDVKLHENEKLLRYKLEKGFAYVKVVKTGQVGWVENTRLIWKKAAAENRGEKKPVFQGNRSAQPDEMHPERIESPGVSMFDAF